MHVALWRCNKHKLGEQSSGLAQYVVWNVRGVLAQLVFARKEFKFATAYGSCSAIPNKQTALIHAHLQTTAAVHHLVLLDADWYRIAAMSNELPAHLGIQCNSHTGIAVHVCQPKSNRPAAPSWS